MTPVLAYTPIHKNTIAYLISSFGCYQIPVSSLHLLPYNTIFCLCGPSQRSGLGQCPPVPWCLQPHCLQFQPFHLLSKSQKRSEICHQQVRCAAINSCDTVAQCSVRFYLSFIRIKSLWIPDCIISLQDIRQSLHSYAFLSVWRFQLPSWHT